MRLPSYRVSLLTIAFLVFTTLVVVYGINAMQKSPKTNETNLPNFMPTFQQLPGLPKFAADQGAEILALALGKPSAPEQPLSGDTKPPSQSTQTSKENPATLGVQSPAGGYTGIYEGMAPNNPAASQRLQEIADAGFDVVLNYAILGGTKQEIRAYLDAAHQRRLKIMFSVKDFYAEETQPQIALGDFAEYGQSHDDVVRGIVRTFKDHPAIWGWYISDERPESPDQVAQWAPVLKRRYTLIKEADPVHPTLIVLSCYQGSNVAAWSQKVDPIAQATDHLGFDSYPVPYAPLDVVKQCSGVLAHSVPQSANRWFVMQAFSWASYPEVPKADGQDVTKARYPTIGEMRTMIQHAKQAGVPNILVYSYFDLKKDTSSFARAWTNLLSALNLPR
jgi:hypothetical protein